MTWHELLSLTPELKESCFYSLCQCSSKILYKKKNGEAGELQLRWGNFYDTINFTKMK